MKSNSRLATITFSLLLLLLASGISNSDSLSGKTAVFTKHFSESLFSIAEKGEVSVEVLLDEKEYKIGRDVIGIVIHNRHDEDVERAKLQVTVVPSEGAAALLTVKEKGDGLYTAMGLDVRRTGRWELRIKISKKGIEDSSVFVFPDVIQKRLPPGKYDAESAANK